jgi:hypothetical protein
MSIDSKSEKRETYKSIFQVSAIAWNIALSSFYFGYCIAYLGTLPIHTIKKVFTTEMEDATTQGLLNGCIPIGALFGALSCSFFLKRFSRRYQLMNIDKFYSDSTASLYSLDF